jgi:hypothetical protein
MQRVTPNNITSLEPTGVFVFGSNTKGKHGKGAALTALKKFGAIYGQARGLQGRSYGIVTKDLSKGKRSIPLNRIQQEAEEFIEFAKEHKELTFYVTMLGCCLAGYDIKEIGPMFKNALNVENIHLPIQFWHKIKPKEETKKLF